ncbi:MAG: hypothetical protein ABI140_07540 [Jatrophihabitantaceae bacterium]
MPSVTRVGRLGVLILATLSLTMTSAYAATWTVRAGTTTVGSTSWSGASTGSSPQLRFIDGTTTFEVDCSSATLSGAVPHLGSGLSGPLLSVTGATISGGCTAAPVGAMSATISGSMSFNGSSYGAAVTTGWLSGVSWHFTNPICSFTVTGATDATYNNSTRILNLQPIGGSGHVLTANVAGGGSTCAGQVHNGDPFSWLVSLNVSTPLGPLVITSP